jgi:hypothetical protein
MVEHYARQVNQKKLAAAALLKWEAAGDGVGDRLYRLQVLTEANQVASWFGVKAGTVAAAASSGVICSSSGPIARTVF